MMRERGHRRVRECDTTYRKRSKALLKNTPLWRQTQTKILKKRRIISGENPKVIVFSIRLKMGAKIHSVFSPPVCLFVELTTFEKFHSLEKFYSDAGGGVGG